MCSFGRPRLEREGAGATWEICRRERTSTTQKDGGYGRYEVGENVEGEEDIAMVPKLAEAFEERGFLN